MDDDGGDNHDNDGGGGGGAGDDYTGGDDDGSPVSDERITCALSPSHMFHSEAQRLTEFSERLCKPGAIVTLVSHVRGPRWRGLK